MKFANLPTRHLYRAFASLTLFAVLSATGAQASADELDVLIDRLLPNAWLKEEQRVHLTISLIEGESGFGDRSAPFSQNNRLPEGVLADEDIRKVLTHLDEITNKALAGPDFAAVAVRETVRRGLERSRLRSLPELAYWAAPDPAAAAWLKLQHDFVLEGYRLVAYAKVIQRLAPSKLGPAKTQGAMDDMGVGDRQALPMSLQRRAIQRLLDRTELEGVLPTDVKLTKLRSIDADLTNIENQQPWVRQGVGQFPAGWLRSSYELELRQLLGSQAEPAIAATKQQTHTLIVNRLGYLIDPIRAGYCAALDLDAASLSASGGDWRKIRTKAMDPVSLKTLRFQSVVFAYSRGCYVPKDFAIVRALYEQWAEGHGDEGGKLALQVNCRLATLYRYGVGGRRDEAKAVYWEERTLRGTGVPCKSPDLVDPRDPMKDLN